MQLPPLSFIGLGPIGFKPTETIAELSGIALTEKGAGLMGEMVTVGVGLRILVFGETIERDDDFTESRTRRRD